MLAPSSRERAAGMCTAHTIHVSNSSEQHTDMHRLVKACEKAPVRVTGKKSLEQEELDDFSILGVSKENRTLF